MAIGPYSLSSQRRRPCTFQLYARDSHLSTSGISGRLSEPQVSAADQQDFWRLQCNNISSVTVGNGIWLLWPAQLSGSGATFCQIGNDIFMQSAKLLKYSVKKVCLKGGREFIISCRAGFVRHLLCRQRNEVDESFLNLMVFILKRPSLSLIHI